RYRQSLTIELPGGSEIPLIDRNFSHSVQGLRQSAPVSRGSVNLPRFFAGSLSLFVFAKIRQSPALPGSGASHQERGAPFPSFLCREVCRLSGESVVPERRS